MGRPFQLSLLLFACLAAPAAAQDVTGPTLGDAVIVAGASIKVDGRAVGEIQLTRLGENVTATARFKRRPPGRKATLCLSIAGERRCVKRASRAGLKLSLDDTAKIGAALRATVRSGS